ncbi:MAG: site-specific integrase, partial [Anaerolineales bacterium]|nr:site-specific integrase [Anaerolineales bacterium]
YLSECAANTVKRQARDLEQFAEYLLDVGIPLDNGADFQTNPDAWQGVTWGLVEGFIQWLLHEGYAVNTVNARLSTVRTYAQMAVKAGAIPRAEGMLIQSVQSLSRQGGLNVDARRAQTRKRQVTYDYKPDGRKRRVVVTRRSTKKRRPTPLTPAQAETLMRARNASPQAARDALLMCLLLEHGLRASEAALLKRENVDLAQGLLRFFRPKVKGTAHEWATHKLTPAARAALDAYLPLYPPTLPADAPLLLTTTRLRKDGSGGRLRRGGLSRIRLSERVAWLGKQAGIPKLSAHDCRHHAATRMARLGYGVDELMDWFGWSSAQTAMRYVASVEVKARDRG